MGYHTDFSGEVTIEPPLNQDEIDFLNDFNQTRRMHRSGGPLFVKGEGSFGQGDGPDTIHNYNGPDPDQPGLWCQWAPADDGSALVWDEGEKFYNATDWMEYIVNRLLSPAARSYVDAHLGEDERLKSFTCDHVVNGEIEADGEEPDDNWQLVVTNNKVEQRDGRIIYGMTTTVKVWSLTTNVDHEIVTGVHGSEQASYESLNANFADGDFDTTTPQGREEMIAWLTDKQGVVLYIEEHEVEVPTR